MQTDFITHKTILMQTMQIISASKKVYSIDKELPEADYVDKTDAELEAMWFVYVEDFIKRYKLVINTIPFYCRQNPDNIQDVINDREEMHYVYNFRTQEQKDEKDILDNDGLWDCILDITP